MSHRRFSTCTRVQNPRLLPAADPLDGGLKEHMADTLPVLEDASAYAFSQLATLQAGGRVKFQVVLFSLACSPTVHLTLASVRSKLPAWPITWFTNSGAERKFAQRVAAGQPVRLIDVPRVVNYDLMSALLSHEYLDAVDQSEKYLYVEPDTLLIEESTVEIDEFFQFDYVGAPWPPNAAWISGPGIAQVGNGGCQFGTSSVYKRNMQYFSSDAGKADLTRGNVDLVYSSKIPNRPVPEKAVRFSAEVRRGMQGGGGAIALPRANDVQPDTSNAPA